MPEDIHAAVELYLGVFNEEPFCYDWLRPDNAARYFTDIENTPGSYSFLYYDNKGLLAGLCLGIIQDYFQIVTYEIKEVAVRKDAQGRGRGTRMLSEVSKHLRTQGVQALTLMTQKNIPAFSFYKKNNFSTLDSTIYMTKHI